MLSPLGRGEAYTNGAKHRLIFAVIIREGE
jgi:hypothetical protein